ncbi:MAG: flagellar hook-basal body complex protein [Oscillospiraceae bacterium]|nr:flagellar hook-basal body complex protein [Oscillospiraceae bacterium]
MVRSLYSGVSGLTTHQTRMDVIGNNIANVNTHGFKSSRTTFRDIYYQTAIGETAGSGAFAGNNPSTVGYGVQLGSIDKDMSQSNFQGTNRVLDVAINGDGFFVTSTFDGSQLTRDAATGLLNTYALAPSTTTYTRMGNLSIDSAGNLVAGNAFVMGTCNTDDGLNAIGDASAAALRACNITNGGNGSGSHDGYDDLITAGDLTSANIININELINKAWPGKTPKLTYADLSSFNIGKDGTISVTYNSQLKTIARIDVAVFDNMEGLAEDGNTSFVETAASGMAKIKRAGLDQGAPKTIQSNKLEMSNVNLANEFSDMIVTQRGYQANARIITTSDSMLEELVNLKR